MNYHRGDPRRRRLRHTGSRVPRIPQGRSRPASHPGSSSHEATFVSRAQGAATDDFRFAQADLLLMYRTTSGEFGVVPS